MNKLAAGLRLGIADDLAAAVMAATVMAATVMAATVMAATLELASALVAATLLAAAATTVEGARGEAFFEAFDTELHETVLSRKVVKVCENSLKIFTKAHAVPLLRGT